MIHVNEAHACCLKVAGADDCTLVLFQNAMEGPMRCEDFSTGALASHTQFDAWRNWYGNVFDVSSLAPDNHGFAARNRAWNLGGLAVNHVTAPGLFVRRTKSLIRREPVDHWAITLSKRRVTLLNTEHGSLSAAAGIPFVVSLGREIHNHRDADERIQIYLSRDTFHGIAPLLDAACMAALPEASSKLLADYMRLLLRNLPNLDGDDAPRLAEATRAMLAACLAPSVARIGEARPILNVTLKEKVRQTIRRHLRSYQLGPDLICREAATSRSQLYRLLESEGGVGRYIQKLRLSEAFSILCNNPQNLTVSAIAHSLCFSEASTFARTFRREFGVAPTDVRDAAQAGLSPIPLAEPADEPPAKAFISCLRR
jgi:AraC-like DNA-binding protein